MEKTSTPSQMDELSMSLAPVFVQQDFDIIERINDEGVTVLMVEQNANMAHRPR
jgi:branched-chain amino acid transport system ATP-binding protein